MWGAVDLPSRRRASVVFSMCTVHPRAWHCTPTDVKPANPALHQDLCGADGHFPGRNSCAGLQSASSEYAPAGALGCTACCGSHAPAIAMPLCRAGHHAGRKEDERDEDPYRRHRSPQAGAPACTACAARPTCRLATTATRQSSRPHRAQASRAIIARPGMHALTQRVAETGPAHRAPLRCAARAHASHHLASLTGRPGLHACAPSKAMLAVQGRMTLLLGPPVAGAPLMRARGRPPALRRPDDTRPPPLPAVSCMRTRCPALHCSSAPVLPQQIAAALFQAVAVGHRWSVHSCSTPTLTEVRSCTLQCITRPPPPPHLGTMPSRC